MATPVAVNELNLEGRLRIGKLGSNHLHLRGVQ